MSRGGCTQKRFQGRAADHPTSYSTRAIRASPARRGDDVLNRQLYADLSIYLADDILVKVDRMSMATSLETRAPFLDTDVMELAFSMPGGSQDTRRRAQIRPQECPPASPCRRRILDRQKEGFSIPMKNWLRSELKPLMTRLLAPDRLRERGLDRASGSVASDRGSTGAGRANHSHVLFSLMVFERWAESVAVRF